MTPRRVFVEANARLHLGLFDLRGSLGRRFGGIGAALESPSLLIEAQPASALGAEGPDAERVLACARTVCERLALRGGARLHVHRALPAHAGLGSGTQLALATARALTLLEGREVDAATLAEATGRAQRSAIGTWAFAEGGFLLEGGRRAGSAQPAPLLLRRPLPATWRCVLALPDVTRGLSGAAEERAFADLRPPPEARSERIAHIVLMRVLPALAESDLVEFGAGITEVQQLVGEMFAPVQGGAFAHPRCAELIGALLAAGAAGAGQSSWGPTVFGLADGEAEAQRLVGHLASLLRERDGRPIVAAFANSGARDWSE